MSDEKQNKIWFKRVVAGILLTFALGSFLFAYLKKDSIDTNLASVNPPQEISSQGMSLQGISSQGKSSQGILEKKTPQEGRYISIRYLHGAARCISCETIEKYANEAIRSAFSDELSKGKLTWSSVNVETSLTSYLIQKYELSSQSLILTEEGVPSPKKWKKLDKIWELLNNKNEFVLYIQNEIRTYMEEI